MSRTNLPALMLIAGALAACAGEPPTAALPGIDAGKGASTDIPVTTTIADADPTVAASLQIRSDGVGAYRNSSALMSVIQPIGAWVLDSYNPRRATRTVYLDFGQPIAGSGPGGADPVATPSGLYKVRIIAKCTDYGVTMQGLAPGATMSCPLHVRFDYAGFEYAIRMNPTPTDPPPNNVPQGETQPVNITCTTPASGSGACVQWRITPSGSLPGGGLGNVGQLIRYETIQGKTTPVLMGDFYFSFGITVTNP